MKLLYDQGHSPTEILDRLKCLGAKKCLVYYTIARLRDTGSIEDRARSGRNRSVRTPARRERIRSKISRNSRRSARKLARDENVSDRSMRRLLHNDLRSKTFEKRKNHGLTTKQIEARLERCKLLTKVHGVRKVRKTIFSDEKLFVMRQSYNAQNDRIYALSVEDIPRHVRTVPRYQNASSAMVWGAVSYQGKLRLKFIDPGVKINSSYYQHEILEAHLLPEASRLYPDGTWWFQQDSAPAHGSKSTEGWLRNHCPNFITKEQWPPSSPDSNPLDYGIWGILEGEVNATQHRNLESMKRAIIREWQK